MFMAKVVSVIDTETCASPLGVRNTAGKYQGPPPGMCILNCVLSCSWPAMGDNEILGMELMTE